MSATIFGISARDFRDFLLARHFMSFRWSPRFQVEREFGFIVQGKRFKFFSWNSSYLESIVDDIIITWSYRVADRKYTYAI